MLCLCMPACPSVTPVSSFVRIFLLAAGIIALTIKPATALTLGERVQASQNNNVRPFAAGTPVLGTRVIGDKGTVIGGPTTATLTAGGTYIWWQVDWDTGVDGWCVENGLVPATVGNQPMIYGIDVSRWQGDINWTSVFTEGKRFAFCKATEGSDFTDPKFANNYVSGRSAGLKLGMYHFARPLNNLALTEARFFVSVVRPALVQGNLVPVLDLESGDTLGKAALSAWARTFCAEVERLTLLKPIIYLNRNYAANYIDADLATYPLWIAAPGFDPGSPVPGLGPWTDWTFQQYSWTGRLNGIGGSSVNTDLNAFRGTDADLARWQIPAITHSVSQLTLSQSAAVRGTTIDLQLSTTSTHPRPILIGASLFPAGTSTGGTSYAAGEGPYTLTAGAGSITRPFALPPAMTAGRYDVWATLYLDVDQNGIVNSGDHALTPVFKKLQSLTVVESDGFPLWAAGQNLSGLSALANADPDKDGADNLTEYAFGTLPGSAGSRPATLLTPLPDGRVAFTFARPSARQDLTWIIQQATRLDDWTTLDSAAGDAPFTRPGISQTGANPALVEVVLDPTTAAGGFLRLKIQR